MAKNSSFSPAFLYYFLEFTVRAAYVDGAVTKQNPKRMRCREDATAITQDLDAAKRCFLAHGKVN